MKNKFIFLVMALILAVGLVVPAALADVATTTIYVQNIPSGGVTGGTDHGFCSADPEKQDEWHFILNGLDPKSAAPGNMTAVFQVEGEIVIALASLVGGSHSGTAHYTLKGQYLDATLLSGYAELATTATYINFVLSHAPCGNGGGGPEEAVTVTKTAVTSYIRTHDWSLDKSVDTDNGYTHDGYPKVWLYIDGSGDETGNWTVEVTYEGYEDSGFNVSGNITIVNSGTYGGANITAVEDLLAGTPIAVDSWVDQYGTPISFPYILGEGEALFGMYSEDVASKIEGNNSVTVTFEVVVDDEWTEFTATDDAEIIWGDPTTEVNKTVTIVDYSDLFGEVTLGTLTAPNGGNFTYTKDFAWADYGEENCGDYVYENTAEVIGDNDVVLDSGNATLLVNVQCYIYETAYAKGSSATCFIPKFANWGWTNPVTATGTYTFDLWAGAGQCDTSKGTLVGNVTVERNGCITVTYNVASPYLLKDTHVYTGCTEFPQVKVGKKWVNTVAPGQYSNTCPLTCTSAYVIAHAVVGIPDPNFGP